MEELCLSANTENSNTTYGENINLVEIMLSKIRRIYILK